MDFLLKFSVFFSIFSVLNSNLSTFFLSAFRVSGQILSRRHDATSAKFVGPDYVLAFLFTVSAIQSIFSFFSLPAWSNQPPWLSARRRRHFKVIARISFQLFVFFWPAKLFWAWLMFCALLENKVLLLWEEHRFAKRCPTRVHNVFVAVLSTIAFTCNFA